MSRWKLGSNVGINGLFHLLINGVVVGVKIHSHLLTTMVSFRPPDWGCGTPSKWPFMGVSDLDDPPSSWRLWIFCV